MPHRSMHHRPEASSLHLLPTGTWPLVAATTDSRRPSVSSLISRHLEPSLCTSNHLRTRVLGRTALRTNSIRTHQRNSLFSTQILMPVGIKRQIHRRLLLHIQPARLRLFHLRHEGIAIHNRSRRGYIIGCGSNDQIDMKPSCEVLNPRRDTLIPTLTSSIPLTKS